MYKCPNGCIGTSFTREVIVPSTQQIAPSGEVMALRHGRPLTDAPVRCAECGARAEWIDARQVELFPIAPTLCA